MNLEKKGLHFETAALSDIGRVRKNNEDRLFVIEKEDMHAGSKASLGIYLIADGMGGHRGGQVASEIVTRVTPRILLCGLQNYSRPTLPIDFIKHAIEQANKGILQTARKEKELYSMGTTCTLGVRLDNSVYLGHVGDSRCYLIRRGRIAQLTDDHSPVAHLLKMGAITIEEARKHPDRGKIFRYLGISDNVAVDIRHQKLHSGDSLVFCSDGLTSQVADNEILDCVRSYRAEETCHRLIELANSRGGEDNISVIVINISFVANI